MNISYTHESIELTKCFNRLNLITPYLNLDPIRVFIPHWYTIIEHVKEEMCMYDVR